MIRFENRCHVSYTTNTALENDFFGIYKIVYENLVKFDLIATFQIIYQ